MSPESLASSREATLALLLKHGESTASGLASLLKISVQAMRRHLRSLEEDGLVKASSTNNGPGHPTNLWQLTSKGHNRFDYGAETFAFDLLESLEGTLSPEALKSLLSQQAIYKASVYRSQIGSGSIVQRMRKLVELRQKEGHMAECQPYGDESGCYINEFHCSIGRIAEKYPVVCEQELEMMRHTFPECEVNRVQWRVESGHSCGFQIKPI